MKHSTLELWEATDSDEEFLKELFYLDRSVPLQYLGEDMRHKLLGQQYQSYTQHMAGLAHCSDHLIYPDSEWGLKAPCAPWELPPQGQDCVLGNAGSVMRCQMLKSQFSWLEIIKSRSK